MQRKLFDLRGVAVKTNLFAYERNELLGGIYSGQFSPTERKVSVSTLRVSTINRRLIDFELRLLRRTWSDVDEYSRILSDS